MSILRANKHIIVNTTRLCCHTIAWHLEYDGFYLNPEDGSLPESAEEYVIDLITGNISSGGLSCSIDIDTLKESYKWPQDSSEGENTEFMFGGSWYIVE